MKFLGLKIVISLVVMGLWLGPVHASDTSPFNPGIFSASSASALLLANAPGKSVSLEQAIKKAKKKYGGKVLSAKEIRSKGPLVYKIKILLPNGRVKTVFVDGESGDVFEA